MHIYVEHKKNISLNKIYEELIAIIIADEEAIREEMINPKSISDFCIILLETNSEVDSIIFKYKDCLRQSQILDNLKNI